MKRVALLIAVAYACSISAHENCGYTTSLIKSGFENGEQPPTVQLPLDSTPLV